MTLRLLKFLEVSARHVERYLSTYFSPNTHLTGEALGLLYIGTQFPELAGARIAAAAAEAGGGQALPIVEVSDALTAEEAKQEILSKMQADGVEGNIDVQVEDGAGGRRIEVKVEKTKAH